MTTEPLSKDDLTNRDRKKIIDTLNYVIDALEGFRDDYTRKFNFTKLMEYLKVPKSEIDGIIYLILNFQEKFNDVFKNHVLKKKMNNGNLYLRAEPKKPNQRPTFIPEIIEIKHSVLPIVSDLIYLFKYVKRGKGFDTNKNGTDLLKNVKDLQEEHPYLFEVKENGLIYPSQLGLKFGELILSFSKNNKEFRDLKIDKHCFKVINDE